MPHRPPPRNELLASLPAKAYQRAAAKLEPVSLSAGEVLCESDAPLRYVYFPNYALVSLVSDASSQVELGLVGREGMVGSPLAAGIQVMPLRALVQAKGDALRMPAAAFSREVERNAALQRRALRYAFVSIATAMQIAACNFSHHLEARIARWLLLRRDRLSTSTFVLTQDLLAQLLGTRRAAVNRAVNAMQRGRLISYRRGMIRIVDVEALRIVSCGCYERIRRLAQAK